MNRSVTRLQIRLMAQEAATRCADGERLDSRLGTFSDSGYLLTLLGFEILLKAALSIHGRTPKRRHSYGELFRLLPSDVQDRLIATSRDRMSGSADYSNLDSVLKILGENFVNLRYPYESYEGISEADYEALGAKWLKDGSPLSDADFVYHPEELYGLLFALRSEVEAWLEAATP